jgi:hypothetical protein
MMAIGFLVAYSSTCATRRAPPLAATITGCTASCSTSGISTSSTTSSSCAPPSGSAHAVEARRRLADRRLRAGRRLRPRARRHPRVVRLQTGYLYHYAFAMLIGAALLTTWFMFAAECADMTTWPVLSVTTFLPLVGALFVHGAPWRRRHRVKRNASLGRALDHADHLRGVAGHLDGASTPIGRIPVRRKAAGSAARSPTRWASTASRCR